MILDPLSGIISGTPTALQPRPEIYLVTATNAGLFWFPEPRPFSAILGNFLQDHTSFQGGHFEPTASCTSFLHSNYRWLYCRKYPCILGLWPLTRRENKRLHHDSCHWAD